MTQSFLGADGPLVGVKLEGLLAEDAPIWDMCDFVDRLDLSLFERAYREDGSGGRPYDPRLMVIVLLWCCRLGVRSPSKIAEACRDRVDLRVILGGNAPSEPTVRRFVCRHAVAWRSALIGTLSVCAEAGLVRVAVTATDGSPVGANASLSSNRSLAWIDARIETLQAELAEITDHVAGASDDVAGEADIEAFVDDVCGRWRRQEDQLRRRLAHLHTARDIAAARAVNRADDPERTVKLQGWVDHHEQLLNTMVAEQEAKLAALAARGGRTNGGPPPLPVAECRHLNRQRDVLDKARRKLADAHRAAAPAVPPVVAGPAAAERVNLTAPTSRICKGKQGLAWIQGDNLILTVTSGQVILAADIVDTPTDQGQLHPSLAAARRTCDQAGVPGRMRAHLADAGFASVKVYATPTEGILLISPATETVRTGPDAGTTKVKAGHEPMAARLATPAGASLYHRRAAMVEPVFAQLFHHGGRHLHHRGAAKHTEIDIMTITHNAGKYLAHQRNTRSQGKSLPLFECNKH